MNDFHFRPSNTIFEMPAIKNQRQQLLGKPQ